MAGVCGETALSQHFRGVVLVGLGPIFFVLYVSQSQCVSRRVGNTHGEHGKIQIQNSDRKKKEILIHGSNN
jgi:hypothetical protein